MASKLRPGDVVTLYGSVGSGKTVISQGIAAALGIEEPVSSATFTILAEYPAPFGRFVHADLYRLHGSDDAIETGLEDLVSDQSTITVIEWADRAADLLEPVETVRVTLSIVADGSRCIDIAWKEDRLAEGGTS